MTEGPGAPDPERAQETAGGPPLSEPPPTAYCLPPTDSNFPPVAQRLPPASSVLPPTACRLPPTASEPPSRGWLYALALVFIGVLVAPLAWSHPRLGRGEKLLIIALGVLNTLAAITIPVLLFFWFLAKLRGAHSGAPN